VPGCVDVVWSTYDVIEAPPPLTASKILDVGHHDQRRTGFLEPVAARASARVDGSRPDMHVGLNNVSPAVTLKMPFWASPCPAWQVRRDAPKDR
jgi:hypothetical protein